jgi:hypothetical protein
VDLRRRRGSSVIGPPPLIALAYIGEIPSADKALQECSANLITWEVSSDGQLAWPARLSLVTTFEGLLAAVACAALAWREASASEV